MDIYTNEQHKKAHFYTVNLYRKKCTFLALVGVGARMQGTRIRCRPGKNPRSLHPRP